MNDQWEVNIVGEGYEDPEQLLANDRNWRIHPLNQQEVMESVFDTIGWIGKVKVNRRTSEEWGQDQNVATVLDGHLRVKLAMRRGQTSVPVEYVDLDPTQEALALATLDPIGAMAVTDPEMLRGLMDDIPEMDESVQAMLEELTLSLNRENGDEGGEGGGESGNKREAPDLDKLLEKWGVEMGDIWVFPAQDDDGVHYFIVGDSRGEEVREKLSALDIRIDGAIFSPPYANQREDHYESVGPDEFNDWFVAVHDLIKDFLAENGSMLINIKDFSKDKIRNTYVHRLVIFIEELRWGSQDNPSQWFYLDEYCWERGGIPGDPKRMGKLKNQWEPVFWFAKRTNPMFFPERVMHETDDAILDDNWQGTAGDNQGTGSVMGDRKRGKGFAYAGNRLKIHQRSELWGHPAAYPPELPMFFMELNSDPKHRWLDLFGGSGSTMIAAEKTSRLSVLVDNSPKYVAGAIERYFEEFGIEPKKL